MISIEIKDQYKENFLKTTTTHIEFLNRERRERKRTFVLDGSKWVYAERALTYAVLV